MAGMDYLSISHGHGHGFPNTDLCIFCRICSCKIMVWIRGMIWVYLIVNMRVCISCCVNMCSSTSATLAADVRYVRSCAMNMHIATREHYVYRFTSKRKTAQFASRFVKIYVQTHAREHRLYTFTFKRKTAQIAGATRQNTCTNTCQRTSFVYTHIQKTVQIARATCQNTCTWKSVNLCMSCKNNFF